MKQISELGLSAKPAFSGLDTECASCDPEVMKELKSSFLVDIPEGKMVELSSL